MAVIAIDFGDDYSTFRANGTYGLTYQHITGQRVPLEGVVRRWMTQPADPADPTSTGDAAWDDTMGFDITRLQNAGHTSVDLARYAEMLRRQAMRVDFVVAASVRIFQSQVDDRTLIIDGVITLADRSRHQLLVSASAAAGLVTKFPSL